MKNLQQQQLSLNKLILPDYEMDLDNSKLYPVDRVESEKVHLKIFALGDNLIQQKQYGSECDIRENFGRNECPNIFVSTKLHE